MLTGIGTGAKGHTEHIQLPAGPDIGKPCAFHIFLDLLRRVHFHAGDHIFPVVVRISCITDHCKPPAGFQDASDLLKILYGIIFSFSSSNDSLSLIIKRNL